MVNVDWCHDCDRPISGCTCNTMTPTDQASAEEAARLGASTCRKCFGTGYYQGGRHGSGRGPAWASLCECAVEKMKDAAPPPPAGGGRKAKITKPTQRGVR